MLALERLPLDQAEAQNKAALEAAKNPGQPGPAEGKKQATGKPGKAGPAEPKTGSDAGGRK